MCNFSRLWNTIHSLSNFNIDFSVVRNSSEVLFVNSLFGYDVKVQLNIFATVHECAEINFDMSAHKNLESVVDMVMSMRVLAVVISDVEVVTFPVHSIRFAPTVILVLCVSYFCGLISQNILPYFTFRSCVLEQVTY